MQKYFSCKRTEIRSQKQIVESFIFLEIAIAAISRNERHTLHAQLN